LLDLRKETTTEGATLSVSLLFQPRVTEMHLSLEQLLRLIERPRDNFLMKLLPQILIVLVTTGLSAHAESAPELSERTVDLGNDV